MDTDCITVKHTTSRRSGSAFQQTSRPLFVFRTDTGLFFILTIRSISCPYNLFSYLRSGSFAALSHFFNLIGVPPEKTMMSPKSFRSIVQTICRVRRSDMSVQKLHRVSLGEMEYVGIEPMEMVASFVLFLSKTRCVKFKDI